MLTISALARRFGLGRSTLMHYERVGLLSASERSKSGYRLYTEGDAARLERIRTLRRAGLGLADIVPLLDGRAGGLAEALLARLREIDRDVLRLREQQRVILGILRTPEARALAGGMTKEAWTGLLAASGFGEADMRRWHARFERTAPERHQAFLEYLCLPDEEIAAIRDAAREPD